MEMKKGVLVVAVLLATLAVKAQVYVGGSFSLWRNSTENVTSFVIAPEIGYSFNEKWDLGAEIGYGHTYADEININSFAIAPYVRWSFYQNDIVRLFLDGTATLGVDKVKDGDTSKYGQVGLRPGLAVKLNDHFSFITKYGFLGYRKNMEKGIYGQRVDGNAFGLNLTTEDLSIGFQYNF